MLSAMQTAMSHILKDNILAFVLLNPVTIESPIDRRVKYQILNGFTACRIIVTAGGRLLPNVNKSKPMGNRFGMVYNIRSTIVVLISK
jgi:hypothetical protein